MTSAAKSARGRGWLVSLMLATFAIGTDDFVVAGVLPAIAADQGVSEAAAGQLVTVFSLTYALAAPPLAVATARWPRKTLVVGGLAVFAVINVVTALAPTYAALMALRVLAALAAAAITPALFALAGGLAAPERVGRAIGVVASGLTMSLFLGVPIGSLLGSAFGWRSTFLAVALFTCAVLAAAAATLPALPGAPKIGVGAQVRALSRTAVLLSVLATVTGAAGGMMTYTYIAPITHDLTGRGGAILAAFIGVVGVAGAAGSVAGGRLTDRWGADRALLFTFGVLLAATAALAITGFVGGGTAPVWLVMIVLAAWGFGGWGFNPPMNARALRLAGDAGTEAVALNTSGLYVGIALAGGLGGTAVALYGGLGATVAATAIGVATLFLMLFSVRRYPSEPTPEASDPTVGTTIRQE
ncbi:Predicted arabinose efflux permease, MFS family [Sinosporangium album]|uniref:Predicted arabinose efflux permease, MFS family n=1 Tax=Sinosporangium album TaxID=504805 RepID=A0A1G8LBD0_9ACTN|nr:MFS transporter [Sinosporangium album]SDI53028.1 Predicted arabinose efflux permease, MFS family [Sinosporangium album]